MKLPIPQPDAKKFIDNYYDACKLKNETDGEIIKSFLIEKEVIDNILSKANAEDIVCKYFRVYFGKQNEWGVDDPNIPKYSTKGDYNLIIVGADDKKENINKTGEIYDTFEKCPNDCPSIDF